MGDLIPHPQYETLVNDIRTLRSEIAKRILERDELQFHICKALEAEYMTKIGALEYKVYEFECKLWRIRRKIELIQAKLNRQEVVILPLIEKMLDEEFREYEERLTEYLQMVTEALWVANLDCLSPPEIEEIKTLYRRIMKSLHPDLNPNQSEEHQILFLQAVKAYSESDLHTLQTIDLLITSISEPTSDDSDLEQMEKQKVELTNRLEKLLAMIENIKNSFPYNTRELLQDEKRLSNRQHTLNVTLQEFAELYKQYENQLETMLGG